MPRMATEFALRPFAVYLRGRLLLNDYVCMSVGFTTFALASMACGLAQKHCAIFKPSEEDEVNVVSHTLHYDYLHV